MAGIIIKGKDWKKEEDAEKKQGKTDFIRKQVGQIGKPLGKIYPGRIRSILNGDTPVIKTGYGSGTGREYRAEGEVWTDSDGKTWKKSGDTIVRIDNEDHWKFLVELRKSMEVPKNCPKCNREMKNNHLNKKFWRLYKQCFDCTIEEHTRMKIDGRWTNFEETKLLENERDYYKDILAMMKDYIKNELKEVNQYVNEDGTIEKWSNASYKEQKDFFENEIQEIEKRLIEIDKHLKELYGSNTQAEV